MFTKYFGLFLIAGGIAMMFFFTKIFYSWIALAGLPFSTIFISAPILLATFSAGIYFYKIGSAERNSENPKIKLTKIAAILLVF